MRTVRTFMSALALLFACVVYMFLPLETQDAGGALLSCTVIGIVLLDAFLRGYGPSPRHWHMSQWLVVAFVLSLFVSTLFSKNYTHALWGFSFDMTSALFLSFVFCLPLIVGTLPAATRRILFISACLSLVLLVAFPLIRSEVYVRPSHEATLGIESASYAENGTRALLVGLGPNSFVYAWQMYKPAAVLTTPFWADDFPVGSSVVTTLTVETGVISVLLLFLIYLSACAEELWKSIAEQVPRGRKFFSSLSVALVLGSFVALVYAEPSAPLVLVSGILLSSFRFQTEPRLLLSMWVRRAAIFLSVIFICVVVYIAVAIAFYFYAFSQVRAGNVPLARSTGEYSYQLYKNPQTARFLSQVFRSLGHELGRIHASKNTTQDAFHTASAYARAATQYESQNGQSWKLLGISLAEELSLQKNQIFSTEGKKAFDTAVKRIPNDPSILFFEAQLYILAGDQVGAKNLLEKALLMKPDYVEASDLHEAIQ